MYYTAMDIIYLEEIKIMVEAHIRENKTTVTAFSRDCGIPQPTIWRFLNGQTIPTIRVLNRIMAALPAKHTGDGCGACKGL